MLPVEWKRISTNLRRTKKLVLMDDSKSINGSYHHLLVAVQQEIKLQRLLILTREKDDASLSPNADLFVVDSERVREQLGFASKAITGTPTRVSLQKTVA